MSEGCARFLGLFFAVLFIIAAAGAITLYQLEFKLLQPDPYLAALEDPALESRLADIVTGELAARLDLDPCMATPDLCSQTGGPPVYLVQLSEEDWKQILELLVPPEWMGDQAEDLVRGLFNLISPDGDPVRIRFDLQPVKSRLQTQAGSQAIELMISSLPPCTSDQIVELAQLLVAGGRVEQLLVCAPPPEILSLAIPILDQQLDSIAAEFPDNVSIDLERLNLLASSEAGLRVSQARNLMRQAFYLSSAVAAGSLALALLFVVRSLRSFFIWTGWLLFVLGLVVSLVSLGLQSTSRAIVGSLALSQRVPMLQQDTLVFVAELINAIVKNVLRNAVYFAVGLAAGGLVLLLISRLFTGKRRQTSVGARPENLH